MAKEIFVYKFGSSMESRGLARKIMLYMQFVSKKKPFVQKNRLMDLLVLECNHKKKAGFDYEFKIRVNHQ